MGRLREMTEFMVDIDLYDADTDAFMQLIPRQRAMVNAMMFEGKIVQYSLSMDRSKLWMIIVARNEEQVADYLNEFPIIDYMSFRIQPLMFSNSAHQTFSQISLN